MSDPIQRDYLPDSPYPGIEPFSYMDRSVFFARAAEIRSLLRLIVLYRGVLLYSDSGTGKSSLVNAGVLPRAFEEGFQAERIRVQPRRAEEIVVQLSEKVGNQRISYTSIFTSDRDLERVVLSVEDFEGRLRRYASDARPLLVFDQFEEWVTLFEEATAGEAAEQAKESQEKIQNAICSVINDTKLPVKVLISLREDYLAKLTPFFRQAPNLPDQYLRLLPLKGEQIFEAIRGPFEKHPGRFRPELSESLAKDIQAQFAARSAGTDVRLTEVQILCRSLFEAGNDNPSEVFVRDGGVQGILERYLEDAVESLAGDQQEPAVALLSRMVTPAGTRNVISQDDLCWRVESEDGIPRRVLNETLDSLEQKAKLVRRERRREVYYYEIASEFLVGWIRNKARERQQEIDRKKLREAELLVKQEKRRAEEQARQATRFRRLAWALGAALLVAVAAVIVAFSQRARARASEANARRSEVLAISKEGEARSSADIALRATARAESEAAHAKTAAEKAQESEHQAKQAQKRALSRQLATQALSQMGSRLDLALLLAIEANRPSATAEARGSLLKALESARGLVKFLHGHTGPVTALAVSPDGKTIGSGAADRAVRLWSIEGRELLDHPLYVHSSHSSDDEVLSVVFSPDGSVLASGTLGATLRLGDVRRHRPILNEVELGETVRALDFAPDGKRLAVGGAELMLLDLATAMWIGPSFTTSNLSRISPDVAAFSPDGHLLAVAGSTSDGRDDEGLLLFDSETHKPLGNALAKRFPLMQTLAFSRDGKLLAGGDRDGAVRVWDLKSQQQIGFPLVGDNIVLRVSFSADGKALLWAGSDGSVHVWDIPNWRSAGQPLFVGPLTSIAFVPGGRMLVLGSDDGSIRIWDTQPTHHPLGESISTAPDWLEAVAFSPDGKTLAVGGDSLKLWDLSKRHVARSLSDQKVLSLAFSADGRKLVSAAQHGVTLINLATGKATSIVVPDEKEPYNWSVALSRDGRTVAFGGRGLAVWDLSSQKQLPAPLAGRKEIFAVAISPDGKMLAAGGEDKTIHVWNLHTGARIGTPIPYGEEVWSLAFSRDGQILASGGNDGKLQLWSIPELKPLRAPLPGFRSRVSSIAFSPDGTLMAAAGFHRALLIFDVPSAQPLGDPLFAPSEYEVISSVAFSPDGKLLAASDRRQTIFLLDGGPEAWKDRACRLANRNLTVEEWQRYVGDGPYQKTCPSLPGPTETGTNDVLGEATPR